jgi:2-succinyl-5-enolpyruvyl-6-hydroxy-3-cyclohexene-1-carboxylate synthase
MEKDRGQENEQWALLLIQTLLAQGIDYFCCGPGSRSTPLALALSRVAPHLCSVHFDERGVCFHAVGYAKAKNKPAAVIVTSGTAVGNLLPGIMEAYNEKVPLLVITADRPPELRDCGANQTCDQTKLFANHVRWQVDLACPGGQMLENYLISTVSHAVAMSKSSPKGPVHLNCMFREPLCSKEPCALPTGRREAVHFSHPELHPAQEVVEKWAERLSAVKNGVILAGSGEENAAEQLAEKLQWPIFADIFSGARRGEHPCLITHFEPLLKCKGSLKVDAIVQFGNRFVSKTLAQWLEKQTLKFHVHISDHPERQDPSHLITDRIHAAPALFVQKILPLLQAGGEGLAQLQEWNLSIARVLSDVLVPDSKLTEPGLIPLVASLMSEGWALFLANSMPVRDANQFFSATGGCGPIFGNRGVSGIDGNIATAAGMAQGTKKPTIALLGDLAFLHDLNSLAYLRDISTPVLLCVVNNGGGGIFSFLPISHRKEAFETFFAAAHPFSFSSAADLFGIPYYRPQSFLEFQELLLKQKEKPQSGIIEIVTDRVENVAVHEQINTAIRTCLNSASSLEETPALLH